MVRKYFCSNCGIELKVTLKALKNKGIVINLIEPHWVCIEGDKYLDNIKDDEEPLATRPAAKAEPRTFPHQEIGDRRGKPVISTAPSSLLKQMRDLSPSLPEDPRETGGFPEDAPEDE